MDMKNISYYLLACLLLGSCSKIYEETDNGVIIKVQQKNDTDVQLVRLQVMGDKLVHVSATPESKFADPQSLVVIPQKEQTPFGVEQKGDTVTVVTSELRASVLASTGEVWFTDEEGNMILQENKGGGKANRMSSITRERMKNSSSTTRRFPFRSSFPTKITACFLTAIRSAVSAIRTIIPSWGMCSSCMTRTEKRER